MLLLSLEASSQYTIDIINSAGGLAQINHPNWNGDHYTLAELCGIIHAKLFEVWNNQVAPNENAEDKAVLTMPGGGTQSGNKH